MSNALRFHRSLAPLLAFLSIAMVTVADENPEYRLAGIVAVGPDRLLAVIEMPDGRQGLFRSGDALGTGRIGAITRSDVRVQMNGQEFLLSLRGNPKLSAATPITADDEDTTQTASASDPSVRTQPLFYEDTVRLLTSVSKENGKSKGAGASPDAGSSEGASAESVSARLGELLGVPPGAKIVAVDGSAVHTPQEVIDKVVPLLGLGRAVRLNLADAGDLQVVYITPVEDR